VRARVAADRPEGYNLRGRALIPGLTDAHVHVLWYALNAEQLDLRGVASLDDALERAAARVAALPPDEWLQGHGWDHEAWGGEWPTARALDAVTEGHPALLTRHDVHSAWANSAALARAAIDDTTPDPSGGLIQRDANGHATGMLFEGAIDLVRQHIPEPTPQQRHNALRRAMHEALSYGMTGLHCPSLNSAEAQAMLHDLQLLRAQGDLPLRCLVHLPLSGLDDAIGLGLRSGLGDTWLRIGGVKLFADGTLGSQTADMLAPFAGGQNYGSPQINPAELAEVARKASAAGIALVVHAIGDAANRKVLDAIEQAAPHGTPPLPHRIEHVQLIHPDDLPRLARLGVVASMQPTHATSDYATAERLWGERCATAYAWHSIQQSGAVLAFGSDAPVEPLNPWLGVHAAVTRTRPDGQPPGGWRTSEALPLLDALRGFVVGPAIASGEAAAKGALAVGRLADLAVLAHDPFAAPPAELHATSVDATFVDGLLAYERR
jgi:predicted amidohydrolase YtcJ